MAAERALRRVAICRRNYMFFDAGSGGGRAATMCSLIRTAKLSGVDAEAWLLHVLAHVAEHPDNRVDEFCFGITPDRWPLPELHAASQRREAII